MDNKIDKLEISRDDLIRLVKFLEKSNELFHQPMNFKDATIVEKFATLQYPEIKHLYYDVFTHIIPDDLKKELWGL